MTSGNVATRTWPWKAFVLDLSQGKHLTSWWLTSHRIVNLALYKHCAVWTLCC